jgi:hypothetical protein
MVRAAEAFKGSAFDHLGSPFVEARLRLDHEPLDRMVGVH